jgi:hypothetical protein
METLQNMGTGGETHRSVREQAIQHEGSESATDDEIVDLPALICMQCQNIHSIGGRDYMREEYGEPPWNFELCHCFEN